MGWISTYAAVMAGGAIGVAARMAMVTWFTTRFGEFFPWGTVVVNIVGCLGIGLFAGFFGPTGHWPVRELAVQVVLIGVFGGFTTFSAFSLQTILLLQGGHWAAAMGNIFLSLAGCLAATWAGLALASLYQSR